MIQCTKINGSTIFINAELIEFLESTPDTIVSTTTGKKILVKESVDELIEKIIEYKHKLYQGLELKRKE